MEPQDLPERIKHYDFDKPNPIPHGFGWMYGSRVQGIQITNHRLCNLYETAQAFMPANYTFRQEQRRASFKVQPVALPGGVLPPPATLPPASVEDLMLLDMDFLMTAIHSAPINKRVPAAHVSILLHTNTKEHKWWRAFLERCPYAWKLWSLPSKMDRYTVTGWMISLVDRRKQKEQEYEV